MLAAVLLVEGQPLPAQVLAAGAHAGCEVLAHPVGDEELRVLGPAVVALGELDLLLAERLAVSGVGVLLVGRAPGDVAVDDDEGRALLLVLEGLEGALQHLEVVGVPHARHVPAIGDEAGGDVLAERPLGVALDGDLVVVVDPAQVGELEVAGQGGGLARDALHHAAVAGHRVDVVVEHGEIGPVEVLGLPAAGDRHADAGGHAGAQRTRRRLDAGRPPVLRVARALAVELAEPFDVLQLDRQLAQPLVLRVHRLHAGQVQQRVDQHGGVAARQHEPVAVGPDRVVGIEAQEALPQAVGHGRQCHGGARMTGVGRLHGIHGQGPDRVDGELVEASLVGHESPLRGGRAAASIPQRGLRMLEAGRHAGCI